MLRRIAKLFVFCLLATTGAFACWVCNDLTGKNAQCDPVLTGAEICVTGQPNQSCQEFYTCDNCGGDPDCGCPPEGCPADARPINLDLRERRAVRLLLVRAKFRSCQAGTETLSGKAKVDDFLQRVERGEFSGKDVVVHMDSKGGIAKALISEIPVSHWRSWTLNIKQNPQGKYVKTYVLETKSGKTVKITLDE